MSRANVPLLAFNRGLISPKSLARVDLDRTRLSAETMKNWLPATQGSMRIRPGTKHFGNTLNDTGAYYVEFVAATEDVALLELTNDTGGVGRVRAWLGSDAHSLSLMGRPKVDTTLTLSDTGWENNSTGGIVETGSDEDIIPDMSSNSEQGVTISASSSTAVGDGGRPFHAADDNVNTEWHDTGNNNTGVPSWWNVDFDTGANGTDAKAVTSYSVRASRDAGQTGNAPKAWRLLTSDHDTGTFATDTGKWSLIDERSDQTDWATQEKRTFTRADTDTGTVESQRHWRLHFTETQTGNTLIISEIEMFTAAVANQVQIKGGRLFLNASSIGALGKRQKEVVVDTGDLNVEHSLDVIVDRGPVVLRVGSAQGEDNYISESVLGTGWHNLAFTPQGNFHVTVQSDARVNRVVGQLTVGDSGTVEIATPWAASNLENIRYDQSADVVYVDCEDVKPHKIERRGTGRSWSVVEYNPDNGPFLFFPSSSAEFSVSHFYGNTTLNSDIPFFRSGHEGALMRAFHNGQSGQWALGAQGAVTDPIEVTGITDTGTDGANRERRIVADISGTFSGTVTLQKSVDGETFGFHDTDFSDTGTVTHTFDDPDDNVTVWYRAKMTDYTSGAAIVDITYNNGGVTGIARVTNFNSSTDVDVEVLSRFSDTGPTDNWQEGSWSDVRSWPTAVALHGGRLAHAGGANIYLSVSDDFENFDDETVGDAAPIIKTLGSGPVDKIHYLVSLLRLVVGTSGAEISMRSSSIDEPLTPDNSRATAFSTQGSDNLRALTVDRQAFFVQRSGQRVFSVGFGQDVSAFGDYQTTELTLLVPDLLEQGIVSVAVQRQPDTRLHCVLSDGTVGILTYQEQESVLCWSTWETDGNVERAMVLPGTNEDAVYYLVNRSINGSTKRFLEKWALESESIGDTGLSFIADCAVSYTDTGRTSTISGFDHLVGESVIVWADDTGQTDAGKDLSPDTSSGQTTYTVDTGGDISLNETVHHAVAGLPYTADWRSAKLAYAAEFGTALAQMKRVDKIGFALHQTHNNGLFYGSDTGNLDALPRKIEGKTVDANRIFSNLDAVAMPFPGLWDADSRIQLRGKAPRPVTVLAAIPTVGTSEKV